MINIPVLLCLSNVLEQTQCWDGKLQNCSDPVDKNVFLSVSLYESVGSPWWLPSKGWNRDQHNFHLPYNLEQTTFKIMVEEEQVERAHTCLKSWGLKVTHNIILRTGVLTPAQLQGRRGNPRQHKEYSINSIIFALSTIKSLAKLFILTILTVTVLFKNTDFKSCMKNRSKIIFSLHFLFV